MTKDPGESAYELVRYESIFNEIWDDNEKHFASTEELDPKPAFPNTKDAFEYLSEFSDGTRI